MLKRKEVSLFAPLGIVLIFQLHLDAAWRRPLAQMTAILAASLGSGAAGWWVVKSYQGFLVAVDG